MNTKPTSHRQFLRTMGMGGALLACRQAPVFATGKKKIRPNILLITADDMNSDSPGCFGGQTSDITPNIDRLASEGVRFSYSHVTIAVCQTCRSVLMTGRYPHRNGAEGFQPINTNVTTLQEELHKGDYLNGILGKVKHLAPIEIFKWDMARDIGELGQGRNPKLYYKFARDFFRQAANNDRIFKNESQTGLTFKAMQATAKTNPNIAARVKLFQYRTVEEFYDFANDPDARHNLSKKPKYKKELDKMRKELLNWMERTNDSALEALKIFMAEQDAKSDKNNKKRNKTKKRTSQNKLLTK